MGYVCIWFNISRLLWLARKRKKIHAYLLEAEAGRAGGTIEVSFLLPLTYTFLMPCRRDADSD